MSDVRGNGDIRGNGRPARPEPRGRWPKSWPDRKDIKKAFRRPVDQAEMIKAGEILYDGGLYPDTAAFKRILDACQLPPEPAAELCVLVTSPEYLAQFPEAPIPEFPVL